MVEGGMSCVKYVFGLFNLLFLVGSCVLIFAGTQLLNLGHKAIEEIVYTESVGWLVPLTFIIVGVIIFIISFLGCCGAFRESGCMLITFALIISLIIVVEAGLCTLSYLYKNELENRIVKDYMTDVITHYNYKKTDQIFDTVQITLQCCGVNGTDDWRGHLPYSCCKNVTQKMQDDNLCPNDELNPSYTEGCYDKILAIVTTKFWYLASVGVSFALIQVLAVILSSCIAYHVRKSYETM